MISIYNSMISRSWRGNSLICKVLHEKIICTISAWRTRLSHITAFRYRGENIIRLVSVPRSWENKITYAKKTIGLLNDVLWMKKISLITKNVTYDSFHSDTPLYESWCGWMVSWVKYKRIWKEIVGKNSGIVSGLQSFPNKQDNRIGGWI